MSDTQTIREAIRQANMDAEYDLNNSASTLIALVLGLDPRRGRVAAASSTRVFGPVVDGEAWWVVRKCPEPRGQQSMHTDCNVGAKILDRPCATCDGEGVTEPDHHDHPDHGVCPDCSGTGRHTFEVETYMPRTMDSDLMEMYLEAESQFGDDYFWEKHGHAKFLRERRTVRVSVVEGMVLPIVGPNFQRTEVGRYIQLKQRKWWLMTRFERRTAGLTGAGVEISLPPAAAPGMWAVKLRVLS
jgi:hypothetical protein